MCTFVAFKVKYVIYYLRFELEYKILLEKYPHHPIFHFHFSQNIFLIFPKIKLFAGHIKLIEVYTHTFFNCMLAHSGVSGIFHNAILPLASPRIKYFIHFPSLEKMRYLNVGGQCSGGLGRSMTSSQNSSAYVRNI